MNIKTNFQNVINLHYGFSVKKNHKLKTQFTLIVQIQQERDFVQSRNFVYKEQKPLYFVANVFHGELDGFCTHTVCLYTQIQNRNGLRQPRLITRWSQHAVRNVAAGIVPNNVRWRSRCLIIWFFFFTTLYCGLVGSMESTLMKCPEESYTCPLTVSNSGLLQLGCGAIVSLKICFPILSSENIGVVTIKNKT